jgi:DnaK suppressor protein
MATNKKPTAKKKVVAKPAPAKTAPAKKAPAKKAPVKKAVPKKAAAAPKAAVKKTTTTKKVAEKKPAAPKAVAPKAVAAKPTAKKTVAAPVISKKPAAPTVKTAPKPAPKLVSKTPVTAPKKKPAAKSGPIVEGIEPYHEAPGEDYMNDDQREHFRSILRAWKRELMEEVDRTVHHMQDEAANFPDPNDRATQESEFSMELRARDRERKLIKKIDETIDKLDHDEYGYCESCGVEIGIRRLEARPTAALCIDCKTLDEIREKQMGG